MSQVLGSATDGGHVGVRPEWHCRQRNIFHGKGKGTRAVMGTRRSMCCIRRLQATLGGSEVPACLWRRTVDVGAQRERVAANDV